MKQQIIRRGEFDTFYTVLLDASQRSSISNFILNDLIENFIYMKFIFDNVDDIGIFSQDLGYFKEIFDRTISESSYSEKEERKKVINDFWESLEKYVTKSDKYIKVVYQDNKCQEKCYGKLKDILNKIQNEDTLKFYKLKTLMSLVEGLAFFIVVPKYKMVLTVQKMDDKYLHICCLNNNKLYCNVKDIYESFLNLSSCEKLEDVMGDGE